MACSLLLLLAVVLAAWLAQRGPWLGLTLSPQAGEGLRVTAVDERGPLAGRVQPGDVLHGLQASGALISLRDHDHHLQPHAMATYEGYEAYLDHEDQVYAALREPSVTLLFHDQAPLQVVPMQGRPLSALPLSFWLLHLYGALACLIGLSVWVFRPRLWAARLLALSGVAMFVATWQHSFWEDRELALPGAMFHLLMRGNHLAMHLLLGAMMVLLVVYPQRLKHSGRIIACLVSGIVLVQLNETLQLFEFPLHTFYLPLLVYYLIGAALVVVQWRRASDRPGDRAALRWVYLSILLAMGVGTVVYILPLALDLPPVVGASTMVGLVITLYLGFAFGILRYRLFELERWWFVAWAWFLGGLTVVLVDLAVVTLFGLNHSHGLALAIIAVGWVYFPIRQWLWRHLAVSAEVSMERHLPGFVEALFTCSEDRVPALWLRQLREVFQPLAVEFTAQHVEQVQLADNGARLLVPVLGDEKGGISLRYAQGGRRLMGRRDAEIAQALYMTAQRIDMVRRARESGADQERQRIMRDLHDDVGGRLLTLIHQAPDGHYEGLARTTLGALRESIYTLDEQRRFHLDELLGAWQDDAWQRLIPVGATLECQWPDDGDDICLSPRHYVNLRRVLDEALTNALKHGVPSRLHFRAAVDDHGLRMSLTNELPVDDAPRWRDGLPGRGLSNIRTRVQELGGELYLYCQITRPQRFCLEVCLQRSDLA
ncbi:hypothetical protein K8B33_03060 [Alcanivorax sp. JB21]|uniref:hypothetical protein n=1 Tax=Alcanivorax limicola TaxID=2874102 RepID=UPI001CBDEFC2|nr:hypothetical protein [Alcanivorax limicola]MBZ2188063.1 hypothetical protein [Alcanivorax limicola]